MNASARKAAYNKAYREANREALSAYQKKWRQENQSSILEEKKKYYRENRDQILSKQKLYWDNRTEKQRNKVVERQIAKKYGLSLEEYNQKSSSQGDVCKICQKKCSTGKRLAVDHNHKTGQVRGLLCGRCNLILGRAEELPDLLRKAADYLEAYSET